MIAGTIALTLIAGVQASTGPDLGEPPSRTELRAAIERRFAAIDDIRAVVRIPESVAPGAYMHSDFAIAGPDRFALEFGHGLATQDWSVDYWRYRSLIRGNEYLTEWPNKLAYETRTLAAGEHLKRFDVQPFIRALGYWPDGATFECPRYVGVSISLLDAVRDPRYRLRPRLAERDGVECAVLEYPGVDEIWLDGSRGWMICRRLWRNPDTGDAALAIEIDESRRAAGLDLPTRCRQRVFRAGSGSGADDEVLNELEVIVEQIVVNAVEPRHFEFEPRPGTLRFDRVSGDNWEQVRPGGLGFLVRFGDNLAADSDAAAASSRYWPPLVIGIFAGLALAFAAHRRGGRRMNAVRALR